MEKIEDCKKCDREVRLRDGKVGFIGLMNDRNYSFFIWDADIEEFVKELESYGFKVERDIVCDRLIISWYS